MHKHKHKHKMVTNKSSTSDDSTRSGSAGVAVQHAATQNGLQPSFSFRKPFVSAQQPKPLTLEYQAQLLNNEELVCIQQLYNSTDQNNVPLANFFKKTFSVINKLHIRMNYVKSEIEKNLNPELLCFKQKLSEAKEHLKVSTEKVNINNTPKSQKEIKPSSLSAASEQSLIERDQHTANMQEIANLYDELNIAKLPSYLSIFEKLSGFMTFVSYQLDNVLSQFYEIRDEICNVRKSLQEAERHLAYVLVKEYCENINRADWELGVYFRFGPAVSFEFYRFFANILQVRWSELVVSCQANQKLIMVCLEDKYLTCEELKEREDRKRKEKEFKAKGNLLWVNPHKIFTINSHFDRINTHPLMIANDPIILYKHGLDFQTRKGDLNEKLAAEYFELAANQGHTDAQNCIGLCYRRGKGVAKNYKKAVKFYQKAAKKNHADALYNLAVCYDKGKGVPKDSSKALDFCKRAAAEGNDCAQNWLGVCYQEGMGVEKNEKLAAELYQLSAAKKNLTALYNLVTCYEQGIGLTQNQQTADKLFEQVKQLSGGKLVVCILTAKDSTINVNFTAATNATETAATTATGILVNATSTMTTTAETATASAAVAPILFRQNTELPEINLIKNDDDGISDPKHPQFQPKAGV